MTEHTPTPWSFTGHERGLYPIWAKQGPLNVQPAVAHGLSDAAFIVKAVNSHDTLVNLLMKVEPFLSYGDGPEGWLKERIKDALASIKELA